MKKTQVTFSYCESAELWEVYVTNVKDAAEALRAFKSVILTCRGAVPSVDSNKATEEPDGRFKIIVGQFRFQSEDEKKN